MNNIIKEFYGNGTKVTLTDKKLTLIDDTHTPMWIYILLACTGIGIPFVLALMLYNHINNGKEKTIFLKNIKSVEFQKPHIGSSGFIDFNTEDNAIENFENRVYFKNSDINIAKDFYETVENLVA